MRPLGALGSLALAGLALLGSGAAGCRARPLAAPAAAMGRADPRAAALVDELVAALGGRAAWERLRCLEWSFAGRRHHVWDKHSGDVRVDQGARTVLMNVNTRRGRVFENGTELALEPAAHTQALDAAYRAWVDDSYWLCAPFKLRDAGALLSWRGAGTLTDGRAAQRLWMTFEGVGVTPENAYELWISDDRQRLEPWAYFKQRDDPAPALTTPWTDWQEHAGILLATKHGTGPSTDAIRVHDDPPARLHAP